VVTTVEMAEYVLEVLSEVPKYYSKFLVSVILKNTGGKLSFDLVKWQDVNN